MTVLCGLILSAMACAPAQGWGRTDRRACAPQSAPVVCLAPTVEGPYELHLGDRVLLPGECAVGPEGEGGGRLRVELRRSGQALSRPRVRAREGFVTTLQVDGEGLEVLERRRCDSTVARRP